VSVSVSVCVCVCCVCCIACEKWDCESERARLLSPHLSRMQRRQSSSHYPRRKTRRPRRQSKREKTSKGCTHLAHAATDHRVLSHEELTPAAERPANSLHLLRLDIVHADDEQLGVLIEVPAELGEVVLLQCCVTKSNHGYILGRGASGCGP
jgi:hypothetical protein